MLRSPRSPTPTTTRSSAGPRPTTTPRTSEQTGSSHWSPGRLGLYGRREKPGPVSCQQHDLEIARPRPTQELVVRSTLSKRHSASIAHSTSDDGPFAGQCLVPRRRSLAHFQGRLDDHVLNHWTSCPHRAHTSHSQGILNVYFLRLQAW